MEHNILVVDDVEMIQTLFQRSLQREGYHPLLASSGEEALVIARRNRIDIFFIDIKLPGMNGIELL